MNNPRILVVEDNPKNMKLIRDVLQFKGFDILEAQSGEEGIEVARGERPTLVLMDVQLPGIDGLEAMKAIKDDEITQDIPVVALTAYAMKGDREQLLAEGFDGYISKPVDIKTLVGTITGYLPATE